MVVHVVTNDAVFDFFLSFLYFWSDLVEVKNSNRNSKWALNPFTANFDCGRTT
jgi:hypothetical protein